MSNVIDFEKEKAKRDLSSENLRKYELPTPEALRKEILWAAFTPYVISGLIKEYPDE